MFSLVYYFDLVYVAYTHWSFEVCYTAADCLILPTGIEQLCRHLLSSCILVHLSIKESVSNPVIHSFLIQYIHPVTHSFSHPSVHSSAHFYLFFSLFSQFFMFVSVYLHAYCGLKPNLFSGALQKNLIGYEELLQMNQKRIELVRNIWTFSCVKEKIPKNFIIIKIL